MNSGYLSLYDSVFFDESTILSLYLQDGMRISHDGGRTWDRLFVENGGLPEASGGFLLYGLEFLDRQIGWAFGTRLIKTEDGGKTWAALKLPEWIDNQKAKFLNENIGYVAGRGGYCERGTGECNTWLSVYKTIDGGKTWRRSFRTKEFDTPWGIEIVDENIAMIIGGGSSLYRTTDGGRTWKAILRNEIGRVMSISRSSDDRYWLFGKNSIRFSDDIGRTWHKAENLNESVVGHEWWSVDFTDEGLGVAVSEEAVIILTRDNGRTWKQISTNLHVDGKVPVPNNPFNEQFRVVELFGNKGIINGSQRDYLLSIPTNCDD